MGWRETCAVDERMRFVMAAEKREEPFAAICRQFGVSRKAGYKWLARYREAGVEGLLDRSRAPLNRRQAIGEEVAERCLAVRRAHPTWGPLKARAFLERRAPSIDWPAPSTIGLLFDREGLTVKRKLRRRSPPSSAPFADCGAANDVWCIDFKGWFLTGDGARCEPLTLTDAMSRYLLRCQALARTDGEHVWAVLDAAFREFGLPLRLRSDNGSPFASIGVGGLSRLSVLVIKAGVKPERIAPGKPQQNGRHERMHLTLLKDAATPPAMSLREQLDRFRAFQRVYNEERPHQGLGNATPAERYCASPRRWDGVLREPDYPVDHEVRRVRSNGEIKWRASSSTSIARSPASRSASPRTPTAGRSASARSFSARSPMAAIACASPNPPAVDLWTTLRVAHRVHSLSSSNIRPERNRNCVTHVIGQICYLCFRLLRVRAALAARPRASRLASSARSERSRAKASSRLARSTESPPSPRSVNTTAISLAVLASPSRAVPTTMRARRGGSARLDDRAALVGDAALAVDGAEGDEQRPRFGERTERRGIEKGELRRIGDAPDRAVEHEPRKIGGENLGRGVRLKSAVRGLLPQTIADARLHAARAPAPLVGVGFADAHRREPREPDVRLVDGDAHEAAVDDDAHALDGERRLGDRGREHDLAPPGGRGRDGEILRMGVQRSVERRDVDAGPDPRA